MSGAAGGAVFLYGFLYFSTLCRNNCNFCYFRRDNDIERYRKTLPEILDAAERLVDSGVHVVDLTTGEDPFLHEDGFEFFCTCVREVKARTGAAVMASPGVIPPEAVKKLAGAGVDFFALYQETHNRDLYAKLRQGQDYDERMDCKRLAREAGMLVEEGVLLGVGETEEDIAHSLDEMGRIGASQIRAMSFVAQPGTPMEGLGDADDSREIRLIGQMRARYPDKLIPASIDVAGVAGIRDRLLAGANVVTSIIPPASGLKGVAHADLEIDEGTRTVAGVTAVLDSLGMRVATKAEFENAVSALKRKNR
ncbi:MAG: methylornithine synthase PylB [Clostridiales Family XIII bacterium]|jgi:methylornithine synthase|nr:methylornithine synthase PylB [Clostridiales Family XIII bacterium]